MRLRQAARIAEELECPAFARELEAIAAQPLEHARALELVERAAAAPTPDTELRSDDAPAPGPVVVASPPRRPSVPESNWPGEAPPRWFDRTW
jgi:hypothetical protein